MQNYNRILFLRVSDLLFSKIEMSLESVAVKWLQNEILEIKKIGDDDECLGFEFLEFGRSQCKERGGIVSSSQV